jgi:hypothetical protein
VQVYQVLPAATSLIVIVLPETGAESRAKVTEVMVVGGLARDGCVAIARLACIDGVGSREGGTDTRESKGCDGDDKYFDRTFD